MKKALIASLILYSTHVAAQTPAMVYDGNPDKILSIKANLVPYNGKIYYCGVSGTTGVELWSYDGVSPGPVRYDYNPGGASGVDSYLGIYKGKLYFSGAQPTTGNELTSFNGTTFSLVYDIAPGGPSSRPRFFTEMQGAGLLFFTADSPATGPGGLYNELYRYDGVTPPTRIRVNDGSNPSGSVPAYMQTLAHIAALTTAGVKIITSNVKASCNSGVFYGEYS